MVADYLEDYVNRTGDWDGAEMISERVRKELHSLINSGIAEEDLFKD